MFLDGGRVNKYLDINNDVLSRFAGVVGAGKENFVTSASLIRDANMATATVTRGSASARPTGAAFSAIKVNKNNNNFNEPILFNTNVGAVKLENKMAFVVK